MLEISGRDLDGEEVQLPLARQRAGNRLATITDRGGREVSHNTTRPETGIETASHPAQHSRRKTPFIFTTFGNILQCPPEPMRSTKADRCAGDGFVTLLKV
jgi:hypothetical protein